jgi:hypothetical protein
MTGAMGMQNSELFFVQRAVCILHSEFCIRVRPVRALLAIYVLGVLVGLWRTDGTPATKLALALLWPIGPLAFVVTISGLVVAAAIAFIGPRRKTQST